MYTFKYLNCFRNLCKQPGTDLEYFDELYRQLLKMLKQRNRVSVSQFVYIIILSGYIVNIYVHRNIVFIKMCQIFFLVSRDRMLLVPGEQLSCACIIINVYSIYYASSLVRGIYYWV